MSRINEFIKIANSVISERARHELNFILSQSVGWDAFDKDLAEKGFSIGRKISPDKYYLLKDNEIVDNVCISGNYQNIKIIPFKEKPKKKKAPIDSYSSPGHLYQKYES